MKRRYIFPFFMLVASPALADLAPANKSDTIEPVGGMAIGDMIPEEMHSPDVNPMIEYVGDTFELAFADYRDRALRRATVHFSTKVGDVDAMRSSLDGRTTDDVLQISGQDCLLKDAIIIINLRCLVGGVVLTLDIAGPIGVSDAEKVAVIEELVAYVGEFPLEAIATAQGEGATANLPPDTEKRLEMRVPGMNVGSLRELVPSDIQNAKLLDVKYKRNDLGFLLEVVNGDLSNDPFKSFFLSDWESFGKRILEAHASVGENGKVTGTRLESWAVTAGGYPCLAAGGAKVAKLDCLIDGVAVLLEQKIYGDEGAPDPQKGTLAGLIAYADTVPFEAIATAQKN